MTRPSFTLFIFSDLHDAHSLSALHPVLPGAVIKCRPIGILDMTDEAGGDSKVLAVPVSKLTQDYDAIKNYDDLPASLIAKIGHFFEHYKDMSPGKWVKLAGWQDAQAAKKAIVASLA